MTSPRKIIRNMRFNIGNDSSLDSVAITGAAFVLKNVVL